MKHIWSGVFEHLPWKEISRTIEPTPYLKFVKGELYQLWKGTANCKYQLMSTAKPIEEWKKVEEE